jgi:hypothetical protein
MRSDLRTLVVCWLIDRSAREQIEGATLEQIQAGRRKPIPHWWPASVLTGSVARGVRIVDRDLPLDEVTLRARVYTPKRSEPAGLAASRRTDSTGRNRRVLRRLRRRNADALSRKYRATTARRRLPRAVARIADCKR